MPGCVSGRRWWSLPTQLWVGAMSVLLMAVSCGAKHGRGSQCWLREHIAQGCLSPNVCTVFRCSQGATWRAGAVVHPIFQLMNTHQLPCAHPTRLRGQLRCHLVLKAFPDHPSGLPLAPLNSSGILFTPLLCFHIQLWIITQTCNAFVSPIFHQTGSFLSIHADPVLLVFTNN